MIVQLEAKNFNGSTFSVNCRAGSRKYLRGDSVSFEIGEESLFHVFQVLAKDRRMFHKVLGVVNLLKSLKDNSFRMYCANMNNDEITQLKIVFFTHNSNSFIQSEYFISFSKDGIAEEIVDGVPVLNNNGFDPLPPLHFRQYFNKILYCDLADRNSYVSLVRGFFDSIEIEPYKNALIQILKIAGFSPIDFVIDKNIESVKASGSNLRVIYARGEYSESASKRFMDETSEFQNLCYISWLVWPAILTYGVVILDNLDKALKQKTVNSLVELFNRSSSLDMTPAQIIFSIEENDDYFPMYPEQQLLVEERQSKLIFKWQNF